MTYEPKTRAERFFRWSVKAARWGNKRRKSKRNSWYDDGWWEAGYYRRITNLRKEHENEMRDWEDYT